jgi:hypothetical protein
MRICTDDALRRVDARWLGVPGWTFPWRPTRYSAYGIGAPIAVVVIAAATRLFGPGLWTVVYGLTIAIAVTTYTMRLVDDERPAGTLPALVWGELGAPRDSRHNRPRHGVLTLAAIPIFAPAPDTAALLLLCPTAAPNHLLGRLFHHPPPAGEQP